MSEGRKSEGQKNYLSKEFGGRKSVFMSQEIMRGEMLFIAPLFFKRWALFMPLLFSSVLKTKRIICQKNYGKEEGVRLGKGILYSGKLFGKRIGR